MDQNVVLDMGNVLLDFNPGFVLNGYLCSSDEERSSTESSSTDPNGLLVIRATSKTATDFTP